MPLGGASVGSHLLVGLKIRRSAELVGLGGRRGKFISYLGVPTNDPARPVDHLVMGAFVYNDHILSRNAAYFGDSPQGLTRAMEIFLHDTREENLQVRDVHIELATHPDVPNRPVASVEVHRVIVGNDYVGARGAYPVKRGVDI